MRDADNSGQTSRSVVGFVEAARRIADKGESTSGMDLGDGFGALGDSDVFDQLPDRGRGRGRQKGDDGRYSEIDQHAHRADSLGRNAEPPGIRMA